MIQNHGRLALLFAALLSIATTLCQGQSVMTHHVRNAVTTGQTPSTGSLPPTQVMQLNLVLQLRDRTGLKRFLKELYNPKSPNYKHFLTVQEFTDRFGPTRHDYDAVVEFATRNGLQVVGGSRDALDVQVKGTVAAIQSAFHVNLHTYVDPTTNHTFYAPDSEPKTSLPFSLWHISGLDNDARPHALFLSRSQYANAHGIPLTSIAPNATTGSGPSASFLGSDMRAAYYGSGPLTGAGQNLGLFEYEGTDLADLATYFKNVGQTNNVPVTLLSVDGTSTACVDSSAGGSCDDTEQTLDMTQAIGMAPGLASLVVYVGATDTAIIGAMTSHNPLPTTIGCSWGWTPADASTLDPYFEKMAAQGQNFFAASGDSSTWSSTNEAWPADDANVVSVGGTDLATTGAAGAWARRRLGPIAAAASAPTASPFPHGKSSPASSTPPTRAPPLCATVPMSPPTPTSASTSAPTRPHAPSTNTAAPALPLPCGPDTSPSSTSSWRPTTSQPSASSTPPSTRRTLLPAMRQTSTTSPVEPPAAIPRPQATTW